MATLTPEKQTAYWRKTSRLMWTIMFLWFVFSFGVHFFAVPLNKIVIAGFPLGFWIAQQGSIYIFIVLIFVYAWRMNRIDVEHGVRED